MKNIPEDYWPARSQRTETPNSWPVRRLFGKREPDSWTVGVKKIGDSKDEPRMQKKPRAKWRGKLGDATGTKEKQTTDVHRNAANKNDIQICYLNTMHKD